MAARSFLILCCFFSHSALTWATLPYCGSDSYKYTPLQRGDNGKEYTLKQVHVIIRHGDRTRAEAAPCWANDTAVWDCLLTSASLPVIKHDIHDITVDRIYRDVYIPGRNDMKGDCGLGHLTSKGYKQEEDNGKNLRKAYVDTGFLSPNYSNREVFFRTDDMSRTRQSAQALAIGMFPPSAPLSGKSQVVDINVMDKEFDDIEPNPNLCPKLNQYRKEFFASESWKQHYNEITEPLMAEVEKALGLTYKLTPVGLFHIADCLFVHICHGFPIPPSVSSDLVERVASEVEYMWYATFEYPTIQDHAKVGIGFLISEIWMAMQEAMEESKARKFYLYSGHDSTVMPFMKAFNASDGKWSPYASMIQLELLETTSSKNTDYAVRLLYHGQERVIPYCRVSPCPLAQFSEYMQAITPQHPDTDCKVTNARPMSRARPQRFRTARVFA